MMSSVALLDTIRAYTTQVVHDANLLAVLCNAGIVEGEQMLMIIKAAADGLAQMSHCMALEMQHRADVYASVDDSFP